MCPGRDAVRSAASQSRDPRYSERWAPALRRIAGALRRVRGTRLWRHCITPAPTAGFRIGRLVPPRDFCDFEAVRRAELCDDLDLADIGLRQHAGRVLR